MAETTWQCQTCKKTETVAPEDPVHFIDAFEARGWVKDGIDQWCCSAPCAKANYERKTRPRRSSPSPLTENPRKEPHIRKLILTELRAMRAEQKTLLERIANACEGLAAAAMAAGLDELEEPDQDALDEVLARLDLGDLAPDAAPDAGRSAEDRMLDDALGGGRPGPPEDDNA